MKRFAIALVAALATSHAQSVTITFTSPTTGWPYTGCCFNLEGTNTANPGTPGGILTFEEPGTSSGSSFGPFNLEGFSISGYSFMVDFTPWTYYPLGYYLPTQKHALDLNDPRFPTILERSDGGEFQLASFWFGSSAIPTLSIDGYRDGELVYEVELGPLGVPGFYEFVEQVNVDRVSFYRGDDGWNGWNLLDNVGYNLPTIEVPLPSTVSLLALGVVGLAWRGYRKERARQQTVTR